MNTCNIFLANFSRESIYDIDFELIIRFLHFYCKIIIIKQNVSEIQ
jgi:hypothetical protein